MLLPAVLILGGLFAGGVGLALVQSLGDFPPAGEHRFTLTHYQALLADPELRVSIAITFLLASIATAISAGAGQQALERLAANARRDPSPGDRGPAGQRDRAEWICGAAGAFGRPRASSR